MPNNIKLVLCIFAFFFAWFSVASAATLFFDLPTEKLYAGDVFEVNVRMESNDVAVNVVQVRISFPPGTLETVSLSKVDSILVFWPEEPTFDNTGGGISFIGGLPTPGFQDADGLVGTIILRAKKAGDAKLNFIGDQSQTLVNDGRGSKAELNTRSVYLIINEPPPGYQPKKFGPIVDSIPPDKFTPRIGRSKKIFDNKYFVVFQTQDHESGISHYEVMETKDGKAGLWIKARSPRVLENQKGRVRILVKAIDLAGNETIGTAEVAIGIRRSYLLVWIAAIVGIAVLVFIILRRIIRIRKRTNVTITNNPTNY